MTKSPSKPKPKAWLWGDASQLAHGFERMVLYEFDVLDEHRVFVEQHFSSSLSRFEKKFDDEVSRISDPEVRAEYEDHLVDEYHQLSSNMPRLQWYAQFLVVYSTFEDSLNRLCGIAQRKINRGLTVKDLSGNGINRAANFLVKLYGVKAPFQSKQWSEAQLLGEIRNIIAHRNGEVEYDLAKQGALAKRAAGLEGLVLKPFFEGSQIAEIILRPVFVRNAIGTLRGILTSVANHPLEPPHES
jgi:hypothetical protein